MSVDGGDNDEHVYGYLPGSIEPYVSQFVFFFLFSLLFSFAYSRRIVVYTVYDVRCYLYACEWFKSIGFR